MLRAQRAPPPAVKDAMGLELLDAVSVLDVVFWGARGKGAASDDISIVFNIG